MILLRNLALQCAVHYILAFHTLTGYDSTSCFKGKGKRTPFKVFQNDPEKLQKLAMFGDSFDITDDDDEVALHSVQIAPAGKTNLWHQRCTLQALLQT